MFRRMLNVRLSVVQIEAFNGEEEAFGWQTTTYPVRQQTINVLKPYLQLYELTVEFENKYKYVPCSISVCVLHLQAQRG